MADLVNNEDDERDDELFREVYSKEYTGPPGPVIKPGTRPQPPARKRSYDSDDDEDRDRDPYGVPRDFTSREARTWEARNRAIEKQQKRKLEEELRCRICGEMGHFAQGCPNTLGPPRGGGGRQGEEVEKISLQDQRLKSRIIGAKGAVIQGIEKESGCKLRLEDNPGGGDGAFFVRIIGKRDAISKASETVNKLVAQYEEEKKTRPFVSGPPQMRHQGTYGGGMDARAGVPGVGEGMGQGQPQGRGMPPLGMRMHGMSERANDEHWGSHEQFNGPVDSARQQECIVADDRGGPGSSYRVSWGTQQWAPPHDYGLEAGYHEGGDAGRAYKDPRAPPAGASPAGGTAFQEPGYGGRTNAGQDLPLSRELANDVRTLEGMSPEELDRWLQEELMRLERERGREEELEQSRHQQVLGQIKKKSEDRVAEVRAQHLEMKCRQFEMQQRQQPHQYGHPPMEQGYYASAYGAEGYKGSENTTYGEPYGGPPTQSYAGGTPSVPQNGAEAYTQAGYDDRMGGGAQMYVNSMTQGGYGATRAPNGQENYIDEQRSNNVYQQEAVFDSHPPQGYNMGRSGYEETGYDGGSSYGYGHEGMAR